MRLNQEQISEAITLYQGGMPFEAVGEKFGVSGNAIRGLLFRRGIKARTLSQAKRRVPCNHNYFDEPLDEERSYWIGFILADGSISEKKYGRTAGLTVRIAEVDRGHLCKLAKALGSKHKITHVVEGAGHASVQFRVSSSEIAESLIRYNVLPRKSADHAFSELIPPHLLKHYFRGYFDGNGGISRHKRSLWTINCCSSHRFLTRFVQWIGEQIGGHDAPVYMGDGIHRVNWSGTHRCREILDLMYKDATVYLDRKMEMYEAVCTESKASSRGPYNRKRC